MSGLAVAYGQPKRSDVNTMLRAINHRGPDISRIWEQNRAIMAQNYLKADLARNTAGVQFPVTVPLNGDLRICFDGQTGNWDALASYHDVADGPVREERLLLQMYQQHGNGMLQYLDDAIFAFVISDGDRLFAARDLLGIKTLFYGRKNGTLYLSSELKAVLSVTDEVYEFPPGHYMDNGGRLVRFGALPETQPDLIRKDIDQICEDIREVIESSFRRRVDFAHTTGALLSGGLDSSVITSLASTRYKEKFGSDAQLKTFALGVGESDDIQNARIMAEHCDTDHHELIVDLDKVLAALPEVIYYLESFDPSLVRSSVSNFLISRYAREAGIEVLLSGEGGDEIFCGYTYFKQFPFDQLLLRQVECLGFLHNNASLRLDRMNLCHSVRVVTPLISGELLNYALSIPPEYKQKPEGDTKIEKWILRKAYDSLLPESITWRAKQEFSQGSGSADQLSGCFDDIVTDKEFRQIQATHPMVRSKEELYYFQVFAEHFGVERAVDTVGQWITL